MFKKNIRQLHSLKKIFSSQLELNFPIQIVQCLRILHTAISTISSSGHQGEAVGLWRLLAVKCGVCSGQELGSLIPGFRDAPFLIELHKYHCSRKNKEKKLNFKMDLPTEL